MFLSTMLKRQKNYLKKKDPPPPTHTRTHKSKLQLRLRVFFFKSPVDFFFRFFFGVGGLESHAWRLVGSDVSKHHQLLAWNPPRSLSYNNIIYKYHISLAGGANTHEMCRAYAGQRMWRVTSEPGHLTLFSTVSPTTRHSRNSISKFEIKSTGHFETKSSVSSFCIDFFYPLTEAVLTIALDWLTSHE